MAHRRSLLTDYQAKRNFAHTSEPSGVGVNTIRRSVHLRFVVQKHDARRLHYDFRLEIGDVFRSWAVTRGPSLNPVVKRLAVAVEEHPLEYGDFEGTIPLGEYGGGTVMIWDRGYWSPETDQSPIQSLRDGELKFVLAGEKLKGSFVLIRLKRRGENGRDNWLLIKHRDPWATRGRDEVLKSDRSVASGRTMKEIAAKRGPSAKPFMTTGRKISAAAIWDARVSAQSRRAMAARRLAKGRSFKATMPRITNPDRVLWTGSPIITKRQLADYLLKVAAWMIPHLYGRPCSLLRTPDGIEGQHFFQRHPVAGQPASLSSVAVDAKHEPYIEIDDAQTLVALSQFSACEFHPWNSAPFEPSIPGRLVFDLDPAPNVPFAAVVTAARDVRVRLEQIGLIAFCKTTGGKGLHVVVPLVADDKVSWEQARLFCQTIATGLAQDFPDRFVATMSKRKRSGRIFVDYLRNDATATAVAPLSPRARPGAPVSMPLTWRQVQRGLDPRRFTILTAPSLITKSTAWSNYETSARPQRDAIAALVGKSK